MRPVHQTNRVAATGRTRANRATPTAADLPALSYWDDDVLALKAKGYLSDGTPDAEFLSGQVQP